MGKKGLSIFVFAGVLLLFAGLVSAKNVSKRALSDTQLVKDLQYTGAAAKRDPFGLPLVLERHFFTPKNVIDKNKKEAEIKLPQIKLQGIIWNSKRAQAIVNGSVMKVGDYIDNFEIKEITKQNLILFFKGKEYKYDVGRSKF
ncbi:MAG: hypothetical protein DRP78_00560 [Candidatus Omnitrophota bacterium]|nr:MAG: hypothetical protein DRP78_00560 [Candidatus Omnitrophota bacterium]